MKTKLLRRLRKEARMIYPSTRMREFALSLGWNYIWANKYVHAIRRIYILRRVAALKQKRK